MNRRNLLNLGLLLLIAVLVLLVIYQPGIDQPTGQPALIELDREAVDHILIRRTDAEDIELERDDRGAWQLRQPLAIGASEFRVDSLLRVTASKSLGRFAADGVSLADYQLAQPQVELVLNRSHRIAFGGKTPLDHRRYVLFDGNVHLINDTLYYHLIGDVATFVRQRPLPEGAAISALELPQFSLMWHDQRWQLEPADDAVSADHITRLLDGWKYASAMQVKGYDGRSGEAVTVTLEGKSSPLNFLLTAREPDLVLARPELGLQYHFPAESAAELLALPAAEPDGDAARDIRLD